MLTLDLPVVISRQVASVIGARGVGAPGGPEGGRREAVGGAEGAGEGGGRRIAGPPGDFGYRARVLVFTCERVRANARAVVGAGDATENAAMRMHGDTLKRMIERFGEDVFRVDVFESDGTVKVERRAGERARERVLLWIASLKCPNGTSVPMKLVDEYVGEREVLC